MLPPGDKTIIVKEKELSFQEEEKVSIGKSNNRGESKWIHGDWLSRSENAEL